jgi:rubrerythrin
MKRLNKVGMDTEHLVNMLQESIIAEQTTSDFYIYIAQKIQNGNIRQMFMKFGKEEAENHKKLLNERLKSITGQVYAPDLSSLDTDIKVSSFSLIGALKTAKESERKAIEFYKEAKKKDRLFRKVYDEIIRDEKRHWLAIDKEKRFQGEKEKIFYEDEGTRLLCLLMQSWK